MGAVKVKEVNLERGMPTVELAMKRCLNELMTAKRLGFRAVILVHGYGSSGTGGAIKKALEGKLQEPSLKGIVKEYVKGESWIERKKDCLNHCNQLKDFDRYVSGNKGITVVLLK